MHAGGVWSTVGYGETGLATVPRSLAADSSSPGATPRPGWENSRRPLRSSPRPRATPVSSGDLSLTAISSNERYHSMMPTLPPLLPILRSIPEQAVSAGRTAQEQRFSIFRLCLSARFLFRGSLSLRWAICSTSFRWYRWCSGRRLDEECEN